jgi:hypothetical protein
LNKFIRRYLLRPFRFWSRQVWLLLHQL